jgi:tetratricopeptide (TPR) repeat protein
MKLFKKLRMPIVLALLAGLGAVSLNSSKQLSRWESPQVNAYNEGVAFMKDGKADEAMVAFDKSLDAYASLAHREYKDSLLYPSRSTELAALAQSKKAILYLLKQKPEQAVKAFKDSITLNPGSNDVKLLEKLMAGEELSSQDVARLGEQCKVVQHNLELLFKKNKSMADGEGKGKGKPKPGDKDGKPGNEPAPGSKPGPGSGKGNPNAI